MISEKITFKDTEWYELVWVLSRPFAWYAMPVVIACHGFSSNKDRQSYTRLEHSLTKKSIATFRFDAFAHGESEGDFAELTLSRAVDWIIKAYECMINKWFTIVGLFGSSFGWCTVLNAAAILHENLACLVGKCPVSDYAQQKEERLWIQWMKDYKEQWYFLYESWSRWTLKVNYWFYEDMKNNNVHEKAATINTPTLIVHWDADTVVRVEQSRKTASLLPDCRLEIIEWAWHDFSTPPDAYDRIDALFTAFFTEHLL